MLRLMRHFLFATAQLILAVFACASLYAQVTLPPITAPQRIAEPTHLLRELMPHRATKNCDFDCMAKRQASALESLGIPRQYAQDARLVFEDVDNDGVPEGLMTVDLDGATVALVVLKRQGQQWYRLPPPPGFSCWCKYERYPLDSFAEIQPWRYTSVEGDKPPHRLIFVHDSGGGTGLYVRDLRVYVVRGLELRQVFSKQEDYRDCPLENKCDLQHAAVTVERAGMEPALVVREFRLRPNPNERLPGGNWWWAGLPMSRCTAYTWNASEFKFTLDGAATSQYCVSSEPGAAKHNDDKP